MPPVPNVIATVDETHRCAQRQRFFLVVATIIASLRFVFIAQAAEVEREGSWAFTERINESTHELEQLAVTPAAEDSDIWLLLACTQSRFTVSLMHDVQFPYTVGARLSLVIRTGDSSVVSVGVDSIQKNQLSVDPATSRHLMPLFLNGEKLAISISDRGAVSRDYTFLLQPNGVSVARIVRSCW
jgi:hypothetical protein